jgi:Tfp pilus assembly protein PilN
MSILTKSKSVKIGKQAAPAADAPVKRGPQPVEALAIGGAPRAHLLPLEVIASKKAKVLRRRLAAGLVVVIVLVGVATGLATVSQLAAQGSLAAAQTQSSALSGEKAKYVSITRVQTDISSVKTSQKSATAQEILWAPYIAELDSTLPSGTSITAIDASIDAANAATSAPSTDPLEGPRIATVKVTVNSPQASISNWLANLPKLPGFVDAEPQSVSRNEGGSSYTVVVNIHVNKEALSNRFGKVK